MKDPSNVKSDGKIRKPSASKWTVDATLKVIISSGRFFNCILQSSVVDNNDMESPESSDEEVLEID